MARGLSEDELLEVEDRLVFEFSADHRLLLSLGMPTGPSFPDWRAGRRQVVETMNWLRDGVSFDVENAAFWLKDWGARPDDPDQREAIFRENWNSVPKLAPLFSHRFSPAVSGLTGAPVYSVSQTDVIYYGANLADYVDREFGGGARRSDGQWKPVIIGADKRTWFWSELAEGLWDVWDGNPGPF